MSDVPASIATADGIEEVRCGTRFGPDSDLYEVGEEIGVGISARVFACVRLSSGEQLAVKVIDFRKWQLLGDLEGHIEKLDQEVQILRTLRHERVVNLCMVYRTVNWYFLVMERCGGELFNQIVLTKGLNEMESRHVFRQLLEGVSYMHSKNVIHRDLKPENILIVNSRPIGPESTGNFHDIKIADFGLSKVVSEATSLAKTLVGTPQYYAPEVINCHFDGGTYDNAADLWGLGAVLFVMLCGKYPFDGKKAPLEEQIRSAAFNMNTKRWANISEAAKDLVRGLLKVDPRKRFTLERCFEHPWLTGREMPVVEDSGTAALVDSSAVLAPVMEESPSKAPSGSRPRSTSMDVRERVPSKNSDVIDATTPLPSGSSSNVDETDEEAKFLQLSRLWLTEACRCWRKGWFVKRLVVLFFIVVSIVVFRFGIFPAPNGHASNLEELPRPVHIELFPTVPILPPKNGGSGFSSLTPNTSPSCLARPGDSCPARPGDGVLLEGSASHPPPHPAERPPGMMPGMPQSAYPTMGHSMPELPHSHVGQSSQGHIGGNVSEFREKETIFHLSELLKLQVSIAGSLEMARLAFRHADAELAEMTRQTSHQAQTLFQDAANVVSRYAQVAQQVSQYTLPDLQLAVQEREPKLASSLLAMVKGWVTEMKEQGDRTQQRYGQLQSSVLNLVRRAQDTKLGADRRLFEAVRAVEKDPSVSRGAHVEDCNAEGGADAVATGNSKGSGSGTTDVGSALKAGQVDVQSSLNSWTQKLFEQLNELTTGNSKRSSWDTSGEVPTVGVSDDDVTWRQDLVDLLFMAPGVGPSSLPDVEPFHQESEVPAYSDGVHVEDENGESSGSPQQGDPSNAVVRYVHSEHAKSEAESATHSAAALLRALRELKRVDQILNGCSAFWSNMDGTVQRLAQMKEHTENLINYASTSPRLRVRFEQRLTEYMSFWASLERLCRQYCLDHQVAAGKMHEFIRDMTDAANLIDTAESARAGILFAKKEKQLSNSYSMEVAEVYPHSV